MREQQKRRIKKSQENLERFWRKYEQNEYRIEQ